MSQLVVIPCKDRIIASADGLVYDVMTGEIAEDVEKIFSLDDSTCLLLSGTHIKEAMNLIKIIKFEIDNRPLRGFKNIVAYIQEYLDLETWKDDDESSLLIFVAGYDGNIPTAAVLRRPGPSIEGRDRIIPRAADGDWSGGNKHLRAVFGTKSYKKISWQEAEREAVKIILQAEKERPETIGGRQQLWHVTKNGIDKKTDSYIKALRRK